MDVLVRWDKDKIENVVSRKELKVIGGGRLKINSRVKMWWAPDKKWFYGQVIMTESLKNIDDVPLEEITSSDSEDDIPLSILHSCMETSTDNQPETDESFLASAVENLNSSSFLNNVMNDEEGENVVTVLDVPTREEAVERAKEMARSQVVEDSDGESADDKTGDPDYIPPLLDDDTRETDNACIPGVTEDVAPVPEHFHVEGEPRHAVNSGLVTEKKSKRQQVKEARLKGDAYASEKSGHIFQGRHTPKPRCNSTYCSKRGFGCELVSEERRLNILRTYYNLSSLQEQRSWLARHLTSTTPTFHTENSRKSRTMSYFLPIDEKGDTVRVCHSLFINTLLVTDRQVGTVISKLTEVGTVRPELRGGRPKAQQARDIRVRYLVDEHIQRYPKVESHYCRADTTFQYLSADLSLTKMHQMYQKEHNEADRVTLAFYYKRFKSMRLKFHRPKKDLCGICECYRLGDAGLKANLEAEYTQHIMEKEEVRNIKRVLKENRCDNEIVACFDLQQVIFLPRSNRGELFYKRRLSAYNFSIYDVKKGTAHCFLWNESVAKRGANEISSNLFQYLQLVDEEAFEKVYLFCDGCGGQNKNSVVCAMLIDVLAKSKHLKEITILYFETNHGQSEGDAVHSVVERALGNVGEIYVPSQLSTLVRMAASTPYSVHDVCTSDIVDYKSLSTALSLLRIRVAEDGKEIRWPGLRQIKVVKDAPTSVFFKGSHLDNFSEIRLPQKRHSVETHVSPAYQKPPLIAAEKYID